MPFYTLVSGCTKFKKTPNQRGRGGILQTGFRSLASCKGNCTISQLGSVLACTGFDYSPSFQRCWFYFVAYTLAASDGIDNYMRNPTCSQNGKYNTRVKTYYINDKCGKTSYITHTSVKTYYITYVERFIIGLSLTNLAVKNLATGRHKH